MPSVLLALSFCSFLSLTYCAAYATYHNYNQDDSLTTCACSDGANGIITRFGYTTLAPMYPYVTAFSGAGWNSPNCGQCIALTSGSKTIYVTVIDQCGGAPAGYDAHFDIAPPAFVELFGAAGQTAGHGTPSWTRVTSNYCKGNLGYSTTAPPPPAITPPPPAITPSPPTTTPTSPTAPTSGVVCGSGRCSSTQCCSKYGWCGTTSDYCGVGCQGGPCYSTPPVSPPPPTSTGDVPCDHGPCKSGQCCSQYGWCGTSSDYCGVGCKAGNCLSSANDASSSTEISDGGSKTTITTTTAEEVPGWAVGLLVLGCILLITLSAMVVILIRRDSSSEKV